MEVFQSRICVLAEEVIIKYDNCAAQQKSWLFISNLIRIVNDLEFIPKSITIDYYETWHSYMSADSVHGNIQQKLNKTSRILNFDQLIKLINTSRENISVEIVKYSDIYLFKNDIIA